MNMQNLRLEDLPRATEKIYEKLCNLEEEIHILKERLAPKEPDQFLTRKEAAELLKVSLPTLHRWTKLRKIKAHGIGNKVLYKKRELEESLININP